MATECEKCKDTGTLPQQGWAWREGDRGYYWCECSAGVARENADLRQEAEDESRAANPLPSRRQVAELEARVAALTTTIREALAMNCTGFEWANWCARARAAVEVKSDGD